MRSIAGLTIVVALLLTPLKCFAQAPVSQSNSSQESAAKTKQVAPPQVEIILKNGQKLKGRSYGRRVYSADCINCRVEFVQNGATQTVQCGDIERIDPQRTFLQKVGHATKKAVVVVLLVPSFLLLMIFCRKDCDL